ncbi:uncharacterized protein FIBRA_05378 [Fibroporia radiculosa]|uniref:Cytochrome P450 n=1 Tax=Fibroporia radiculosa TaxID=599839 RepID=J4HXF0_9APHY|nr:uncharacterized protein FIBRA_05378 [Fibroporia radiculosa]CCM03252.1 predicted protein [Fibroporia radiculosa]
MQNIILLLCFVFACVLLMHLIPYFYDSHGLRAYPGPFFAKFTDLWLGQTIFSNTWSETVEKLHKKHGPFVRIGPNYISISDPAALVSVYGHTSGALKAPFYDSFVAFKHASVFSTRSRADHARKRRVHSLVFSQKSIRALESTTRVHFAKLVEQWDTLCKCVEGSSKEGRMGSSTWSLEDGRVWFDCMTCDLAFGSPFGMVRAAKDETWVAKYATGGIDTLDKCAFDMERIPVIGVLSVRAEVVPIFGFLPARWRPLAQWHPRLREGNDAAKKLAGLSIASVSKRLENPEVREDMLQKLLEGRVADGIPMSPDEMAAEAFTLIIAGAETMAM